MCQVSDNLDENYIFQYFLNLDDTSPVKDVFNVKSRCEAELLPRLNVKLDVEISSFNNLQLVVDVKSDA